MVISNWKETANISGSKRVSRRYRRLTQRLILHSSFLILHSSFFILHCLPESTMFVYLWNRVLLNSNIQHSISDSEFPIFPKRFFVFNILTISDCRLTSYVFIHLIRNYIVPWIIDRGFDDILEYWRCFIKQYLAVGA